MNSGQRRSRRGMTLLEVVLAVTLLAAMSGLIAAMWTQAMRLADDGGGQHRAMRLARVLEMMRSQWADRRTSVELGERGSSLAVDPAVLTFITTTPVLEPGWPIVRARYVVERDFETGLGEQTAWRLVYEELPVVDLAAPQDLPDAPAASDEPGERSAERPSLAPREKRLVLLAACAELKWERFGRGGRVEAAERSREGATDEASLDLAAKRAAGATKEEKELAWRPLETDSGERSPPAIRLVGEFEEKEFACVFVIGDSR